MKKRVIIFIVVAALLLATGLSYAYFTGRVLGDKKELIVTSKNIRIVFTDEKEISNSAITPGWSESKKFSVKNESNDVFYYNIVFENLVNTFVTEGFLQYKITSTDGGYSSEGYLDIPKSSTPTDVILASNIVLPIDVTHNYVVEFVYHDSDTVNQNEDQGKIFEGNLFITEGKRISIALTDKLKSDYEPKPGRTDFSVIDNSEAALYTSTDDQGTTYYFSGDGTDMRNWVSYAGSLWRVIRINGNGSVRLLYAGSGGEDGYIGEKQYYSTEDGKYNNPGYVGYKYGLTQTNGRGTTESYIYKTLKEWYNGTTKGSKVGLTDSDREYIDTSAVYCNDRTASTSASTTNNYTTFTAKDNLTSTYYYGTYKRLYNKSTPTLSCSDEDKFAEGIGLMTADEVVMAGGLWLENNDNAYYYLNKTGGSSTGGSYWWTGSPYNWSSSSAWMLYVCGSDCSGRLSWSKVNNTAAVRPVVSLKSCVEVISGDGSSEKPYEISKNSCYNYEVKVEVTNGTVDTPSKTVSQNDIAEFTITPNEGYILSDATVTGGCTLNEKTGTLKTGAVSSNMVCNVTLKEAKKLSDIIKIKYPSKGERTEFKNVYTTTGMHETKDNFGTTYYFTGNPDNWVSFAGKLWRIVRINGDGSVRLLYAGTGGEDGFIGISEFNTNYNHPGFVGWMYGNGNNIDANRANTYPSTAYTALKNWFNSISAADKEYININAIYCNDREGTVYNGQTLDAGFNPYIRITNSVSPTLRCEMGLDRFQGEGFGLITADEIVFAGSNGGISTSENKKGYYYLNKNGGSSTGSNNWWTMSPYYFFKESNGELYGAHNFYISGNGRIGYQKVNNTFALRPVISLKQEVMITGGTGTASNPYKLTMS